VTIERAIDKAGRRPQPKRSWLRFMQGALPRHAILVAILAVGFACGSPSDTEPSAEVGDVDWADGVGAPSVRVLVVKGEEVEETWIPAVGTAIPDEDPPGKRIARLQLRDEVVVGDRSATIEPGFMFLAAAAAECGIYHGSSDPHGLDMKRV